VAVPAARLPAEARTQARTEGDDVTSDELLAAAERLSAFCNTAMQGTPSQAPAYRDAAYCDVYRGTPRTQLGDINAIARAYLAEHPAPNPEHEKLAAAFRDQLRNTEDGDPEGTAESLRRPRHPAHGRDNPEVRHWLSDNPLSVRSPAQGGDGPCPIPTS
jgi:hypothetical protein